MEKIGGKFINFAEIGRKYAICMIDLGEMDASALNRHATGLQNTLHNA